MSGANAPADAATESDSGTADGLSLRPFAIAAGVVFWGWLCLRWLNDWAGGLLVAPGEPFVPAATIEGVADGVPVVAGVFDSLGFAALYLPAMANAVKLTLVLTVVSIAVGFLIAVPLAVARVYGRLTAHLSLLYTELLRGTPLLAQLFFLYYALNLVRYVPEPLSGLFGPDAVWVAIVGFVLNGAAYQAEYLRAAIQSVPEKQLTAGRAVGLSKLEGIRFIVLPQGLRYAIPSWSNELIYLIKYSSLAAFIQVPELFKVVNGIASQNFRYTAMFSLAALFYLALVLTASRLMEWVERRTGIPGVGGAAEGRA